MALKPHKWLLKWDFIILSVSSKKHSTIRKLNFSELCVVINLILMITICHRYLCYSHFMKWGNWGIGSSIIHGHGAYKWQSQNLNLGSCAPVLDFFLHCCRLCSLNNSCIIRCRFPKDITQLLILNQLFDTFPRSIKF